MNIRSYPIHDKDARAVRAADTGDGARCKGTSARRQKVIDPVEDRPVSGRRVSGEVADGATGDGLVSVSGIKVLKGGEGEGS